MSGWVVLGAGGMLGQALARRLPEARALDHLACDVTDPVAVAAAVGGAEVVVNCAAWTDVDGAEAAQPQAHAVNAVGAQVVAHACRVSGARLLHPSTDYVFDGQASSPYAEDSPTGPRSAYGRSKLAGEQAVLGAGGTVVRTAWLYGTGGPSFVATMVRLERERPHVDVVVDQVGQPTWTGDLATALVALGSAPMTVPGGIYHATNAGAASWFELARAVFERLGADPGRVRPTTSEDFVRPAPRPAYSVLSHGRWLAQGLPPLRPWPEALDDGLPDVLRWLDGP